MQETLKHAEIPHCRTNRTVLRLSPLKDAGSNQMCDTGEYMSVPGSNAQQQSTSQFLVESYQTKAHGYAALCEFPLWFFSIYATGPECGKVMPSRYGDSLKCDRSQTEIYTPVCHTRTLKCCLPTLFFPRRQKVNTF